MTNRWQRFLYWLDRRLFDLEPWLKNRAQVKIERDDIGRVFTRYFILRTKRLGIFMHRFDQDDVELHDHPWNNISIPLTGSIIENHHDGTYTMLRPFRPYWRNAEKLHMLHLPTRSPVWTLFIRFRRFRDWGFAPVVQWDKADNSQKEWSGLEGMFFPREKPGTIFSHNRERPTPGKDRAA